MHIAALLRSLASQTVRPDEIIVVNNASTDRTREVANSFQGQIPVTVIDEPMRGRGAARSAGFARATGEILFSTDADSTVPPNWIESFLPFFNNQEIVAVAGRGVIKELRTIYNMAHTIIQPLFTIGFAGFNFAIRKNTYQQSGGFNRILNAWEDTDLAYRVADIGVIQKTWRAPVTVSARRFQKRGVTRGLLEYIQSFSKWKYLRQQNAILDDPR